MRVIRGRHNIRAQDQGCVITIGNFDGVHLGHQAILRKVKRVSEELACPSLLICFEPQPKEFFESFQAPARLTRFREKVKQLSLAGLDRLLCLQFNAETRGMSVEDFIALLTEDLKVKALFVGDDFKFGADRQGDFEALTTAGAAHGFSVDNFSTLTHDSERISSTRIRGCLAAGDMPQAEIMLGRPYAISGRVVYGQQIGRTLGVPTANIQLHRYKAPLSGVYLVEVLGLNRRYPGVANVGVRPTVESGGVRPILEVHLLDFEGDLYGRQVEVVFIEKLREERKFSGLPALKTAIHNDIAQARRRFEQSS